MKYLKVSDHKKSHYGQLGEDAFLEHYFKNQKNGVYIDIGCHHPERYSNTFLLYSKMNWSGLNIDANPDTIQLMNESRTRDINVNCGIASQKGFLEYFRFTDGAVNTFDKGLAARQSKKFTPIETVNVLCTTLGSISKEYPELFEKCSYMNIDCEGLDQQVLEGNDWDVLSPEVISIEIHGINLWSLQDNHTCQYLDSRGYRPIAHYFATTFFKKVRT